MQSRRSSSLDETALRNQLGQAHMKISSLEDYIRQRELAFHAAVNSMRGERRDSQPPLGAVQAQRVRRAGRTGDVLLRARSFGSIDSGDPRQDAEFLEQPLGEFVLLRLTELVEREEGMPMPFLLRRLVGRCYHVGPEGAVIGSDPSCSIAVPPETEVLPEHCCFSWEGSGETEKATGNSQRRGSKLLKQKHVNEKGHFVLEDLTEGRGILHVSSGTSISPTAITEEIAIDSDQADLEYDDGNAQELASTGFPMILSHGLKFVTGRIVWAVSALPTADELLAKAFHLASQRDLPALQELMESTSRPTPPAVTVTGTEGFVLFDHRALACSPFGSSPLAVDVNCEYSAPSYHNDEYLNLLFSSRKSSGAIFLSSRSVTPGIKLVQKPHLLLHVAIENNHSEMVEYLLGRRADVNKMAGELHYSAVHLAAQRNSTELISLLLQHGADLELRNAEHLPPLALTTSYEVRKKLLNSVLLCAAADAGDSDEVTRLLSSGISPNVRGLRHRTALHCAASSGRLQVVELLLMNGADVNMLGGSRQRTALHYASASGHSEVVQLLLKAGANEFVRDSGGYTALNICRGDACMLLHRQPLSLCLAVQSGDAESVREILEERDDSGGMDQEDIINLRNDQNHAPLHLACILGSLDTVELLVSNGAEVNLHGGTDSWTPLFYAAMAGHAQIVEFLLSFGADAAEEDGRGERVRERLEKAVDDIQERISRLQKRERSQSMVEERLFTRLSMGLLRQESAPSCSVESELLWAGQRLARLQEALSLLTSPAERLRKALEEKDLPEFMHLIESGTVDTKCPADGHGTASLLVHVCEDGLFAFAKVLLENGADPNYSGPVDDIPLLVATREGHTPIVRLLVEHGAQLNIRSTSTLNTALHEAAAINDSASVQYLLSVGADPSLVNSMGELPFDQTNLIELKKLLAVGNYHLLLAAALGDTGCVQRLVQKEGINVNWEFLNGWTALHEACEAESDEAVSLLLELGADVNKRGGVYQTAPLHIASQNNLFEIARLLLKSGAKLDIKDTHGKVPFEVACTNQMRRVLVEARTIHPSPVASQEGMGTTTDKLCLICMDKPINTLILPCGHQAFCKDCVTQISHCALDRQAIREVISVYR